MIRYFFMLLLAPLMGLAQRIDVDVFTGMGNYQGDLQFHFFTFQNANPAGAVILKIGLTDQIYVRTGFAFTSIAAFDKDNIPRNKSRNLNFRTSLQEYTAGIEYRVINPENYSLTPYLFAGVGAFHFNPYTYYPVGGSVQRVYLQPLSTEGQGLADHPDRIPYKLTQFCIPYGVGFKWRLNCNLNLGVELRHTKTFTDYLDDVSMNYVDEAALLAARGQLAVDLAWRQDEYDGRRYPAKGTQRGNPGQGDLYYMAGITLGLRLNDCETGYFSLGGLFNGDRSLFNRNGSVRKNHHRQLSCPKF